MLPKGLRDEIWAAYVPGQEVTKTPSKRYVEVARRVRLWIIDNHRHPRLDEAMRAAREAIEKFVAIDPKDRDSAPEGRHIVSIMQGVEFLWDFLREEEQDEIMSFARKLERQEA